MGVGLRIAAWVATALQLFPALVLLGLAINFKGWWRALCSVALVVVVAYAVGTSFLGIHVISYDITALVLLGIASIVALAMLMRKMRIERQFDLAGVYSVTGTIFIALHYASLRTLQTAGCLGWMWVAWALIMLGVVLVLFSLALDSEVTP